MHLPKAKDLKQLAKACREAGITHFKNEHFEINVSEEAPQKARKSKEPQKTENVSPANEKFTSDSLSDADLLMWSANPGGQQFNFEVPKGDES